MPENLCAALVAYIENEGGLQGKVFSAPLPERPLHAVGIFPAELHNYRGGSPCVFRLVVRGDLNSGQAQDTAGALTKLLDERRDTELPGGIWLDRMSLRQGFGFDGVSGRSIYYTAELEVW